MNTITVECIEDVEIFGTTFRAGQQYRVESKGASQFYPSIVGEDGVEHVLLDEFCRYFEVGNA